MNTTDTNALIRGILEAQIIQALNSAPDAIAKMVKAAISEPVDPRSGRNDGYSSGRIPYLDYLVGEEIREAARVAAKKVILEKMPDIEAQIRSGLSSESVVAAVVGAFVSAASERYRIAVRFESEKD